MQGIVDKVGPRDVTGKVSEGSRPTLRRLQGFSGCYVFDDAQGVAALAKSETDSRTVQGGFHESATAW
jgi:hypothetical protein